MKQTIRFLPILFSFMVLAAGFVFDAPRVFAQQNGDVEMSGISGDRDTPRRHFRLKDPENVSPKEAQNVYEVALQALGPGYARSGNPTARDYRNWRRYNNAPYLSSRHGNHYLNNYANETARAYGAYEKAGKLPLGSVIAKDSFSITETGGILLGSLFLMEKMPQGFNYVSGDWKYSVIKPDGRLFGETNGKGSGRVEYCITCHLVVEQQDHLFFVPQEYRVDAAD